MQRRKHLSEGGYSPILTPFTKICAQNIIVHISQTTKNFTNRPNFLLKKNDKGANIYRIVKNASISIRNNSPDSSHPYLSKSHDRYHTKNTFQFF
jgi:hypothetical protein